MTTTSMTTTRPRRAVAGNCRLRPSPARSWWWSLAWFVGVTALRSASQSDDTPTNVETTSAE